MISGQRLGPRYRTVLTSWGRRTAGRRVVTRSGNRSAGASCCQQRMPLRSSWASWAFQVTVEVRIVPAPKVTACGREPLHLRPGRPQARPSAGAPRRVRARRTAMTVPGIRRRVGRSVRPARSAWCPGCSRQPYSLAEPGNSRNWEISLPPVSIPARSVTGWPNQVASAAPTMAGTACTTKRSRWRRAL
jgi:hypothetical protein